MMPRPTALPPDNAAEPAPLAPAHALPAVHPAPALTSEVIFETVLL